jgi:hypothetical protein
MTYVIPQRNTQYNVTSKNLGVQGIPSQTKIQPGLHLPRFIDKKEKINEQNKLFTQELLLRIIEKGIGTDVNVNNDEIYHEQQKVLFTENKPVKKVRAIDKKHNDAYLFYQRLNKDQKERFKQRFMKDYETELGQYKYPTLLFEQYFDNPEYFKMYDYFDNPSETSKRPAPRKIDKLSQQFKGIHISYENLYPLIDHIKVVVCMDRESCDLNHEFLKKYSTIYYRDDRLIQMINDGTFQFDLSMDSIMQSLISGEYILNKNVPVTLSYPFLKGLIYKQYDTFLSTGNLEQILFNRVNGRRQYSTEYSNDILWDLNHCMVDFKLKQKFIYSPYTKLLGCGINLLYFFGLTTKEETQQLAIEHFKNYNFKGTPLSELSTYLSQSSNVITIPIIGEIDQRIKVLNEVLTELSKCIKDRHYTFIKFIIRLDNIESGHSVGIIKLDTILHIVDVAYGYISNLSNNILNYFCSLYDGIQVITTEILTDEQQQRFDMDIEKSKDEYALLDPIMREPDIKALCIEGIKKTKPDMTHTNIESTYDKIVNAYKTKQDENTIAKYNKLLNYGKEYLRYKSMVNQKDQQGGKKHSKKNKKTFKKKIKNIQKKK